MYKNTNAFVNKTEEVCYIPELTDEKYTYKDFLDIAGGNEKIAEMLFEDCDWQHPETRMDELEELLEEEN